MADVRYATCNIQGHANPTPWATVRQIANEADVIGFQEVTTTDAILAVRRLTDFGWKVYFGGSPAAGQGAQYEAMAYRGDRFRALDQGAIQAHPEPKRKGWGPSRWILWLALEDRATGARFAAINTHMIHQAWSSVPERRLLWNQHATRLRLLVDELRVTWGNIIGGGDVNRSKWAPPGTVGHWAAQGTLGPGIFYDVLFTAGQVDASTVGRIVTSSDHDALAAAFVLPAPKEKPVTTRVNLGLDTSGRPLVLDTRTLAKLRAAEDRLGFKFTIVQGSYRAGAGAKASAGTHDGGGVIDLRTWNLPARITPQRAVRVLRECGLIAWYRTSAQGFDPHIHAIDYGNPALAPSAARQVTAWQAGRNGLASNGPDDGPRVNIPKNPPAPTQKDWFDMATKDELKDAIREVLNENDGVPGLIGPWGNKRSVVSVLQTVYNMNVPGKWRNQLKSLIRR